MEQSTNTKTVTAMAVSTTPERGFIRSVLPYIKRTTITIALALASAFGVLSPEKATQLRDIVLMLPAGSGDLVN